MTFVEAPEPEHPTALVGRVARLGAWNVLAYVLSASVALLINVVAGRKLGPAGFGQYSYVVWIVRTIAVVGALGIPAALTRLVAEFQGADDPEGAHGIYRRALRLMTFLSPFLFGSTALWVLATTGNLLISAVMGGTAIVFAFFLVLEQTLNGLRRFQLIARNSSIVSAAHLPVILILAIYIGRVRDFLLFYGLISLIFLVVWGLATNAVMKKWTPRSLEVSTKQRLTKLSLTLAVVAVSDTVLWGRPEIFFLQRWWTQREVGLYSAALVLYILTISLPYMAARVLTPEFGWLRGGGQEALLKRAFPSVCTYICLIAIPLGVGGAIVARDILVFAYGSAFAPAAIAASILMAGNTVVAIAGPASAAAVTGPQPGFLARLAAVMAGVNLLLDVALIPLFGIEGAAFASITSQALAVGFTISHVKRTMDLAYPLGTIAKITIAAAMSAIVSRFVTQDLPGHLPLFITILLTAVLYFAAVRLMGIVRWSTLRDAFRGGLVRP